MNAPPERPRKEELIPLVCEPWCAYFKPDRVDPDEECGGLTAVRELIPLSPDLMEVAGREAKGKTDQPDAVSAVAQALCPACPYRANDCDFADPDGPVDAPPCGGLRWLADLLDRGVIDRDVLARAGRGLQYLALAGPAVLKRLETPHVYHLDRDDLYEVNDEAFSLLLEGDGRHRVVDLRPEPLFLDFCLAEDLLALSDAPRPTKVRAGGQAPTPSLRYLELQITRRCNLACRHCYLGRPEAVDMASETVALVLDDFCQISGLRVMVSGGEPLSHPRFEEINDLMDRYPLRRVLLTNGTLLTLEMARRLRFHEVQVSLDGLEAGHDALRGPGSFQRALAGLQAAREAGLDVSVATMVHAANLDQFEGLARLMEDLGVIEWGIDAPCLAGRYQEASDLQVSPQQAARAMAYGFGGSFHGGDGEGYTCGRHLLTVTPEGQVAPCGFYEPLGRVEEGLSVVWGRRRWVRVQDLECAGCPHLMECGGGCRFRAGSPLGPDPVMCAVYQQED